MLLLGVLVACNPILAPKVGDTTFRPPNEGEWTRFFGVRDCLQRFAKQQWPDSNFTYGDVPDLVIGDMIGGSYGEFVRGDTAWVNIRAAASYYVYMQKHAFVHIVQQRHPELQLYGKDIHWAPPFNFCGIPRSLYG